MAARNPALTKALTMEVPSSSRVLPGTVTRFRVQGWKTFSPKPCPQAQFRSSLLYCRLQLRNVMTMSFPGVSVGKWNQRNTWRMDTCSSPHRTSGNTNSRLCYPSCHSLIPARVAISTMASDFLSVLSFLTANQ